MLLDFNEIKEMTVPGMNHGTGTMTAKIYMDEQGKIIPCSILQNHEIRFGCQASLSPEGRLDQGSFSNLLPHCAAEKNPSV